jgi:hypothetical protein
VPENAERVAKTPLPLAGEVRELKAIPFTCLPAMVPTVNNSTVLNVPALDRE